MSTDVTKSHGNNRTHEPSLRELTANLDGLRDLLTNSLSGIKDLINERDKRYTERFEASQKAVETAFASAKEAVQAALISAEKAGEKTELALKEYKIASNEWRDTVKDLVSRMPTRSEVETGLMGLRDKIDRVDADFRKVSDAMIQSSGKGLGRDQLWAYIVQGIMIFVSVWGATHFGK